MEWRDEGLVLGVKRHGETSIILELMTRAHGRHRGVVRGGRSARLRPVLQAGNSVEAGWRARLDEHLGNFTVEGTVLRAAEVIADPAALDGVNLLAALLRLLPERDPHEKLYEAAALIADCLTAADVAPALMARFELGVLAELGFGLELTQCAVTGAREDLAYVSPKTGRAVGAEPGAPYRTRLLPLPRFLTEPEEAAPPAAVLDAFALTGHFLARDVFAPRGLEMPAARTSYIARLAARASAFGDETR